MREQAKSLKNRLQRLSILTAVAAGMLFGAYAQAQEFPKPPYYRWVDAQGRINFSDRPPPPDARDVEVVNFSSNEVGATVPYAVQRAAEDFPVTLYTSENCGQPCTSALELLRKRQVPFVHRQISSDDQIVMATYLTTLEEPVVVPAATVGRFLKLKGFDDSDWNRALTNAGYPK